MTRMKAITLPVQHQVHTETFSHQTLSDLDLGSTAVIQKLDGSSARIRQRLLEMGLTRGTCIQVIRFAPFGDPIEIAVRGYRLSLRKEEASFVIVRQVAQ